MTTARNTGKYTKCLCTKILEILYTLFIYSELILSDFAQKWISEVTSVALGYYHVTIYLG